MDYEIKDEDFDVIYPIEPEEVIDLGTVGLDTYNKKNVNVL